MDDVPELRSWLTLICAPQLGASVLRRLMDYQSDPLKILNMDRQQLLQAGLSDVAITSLRKPDQAQLDACHDWLSKAENHLLTIAGNDFPPRLKDIPSAPAWLFVSGDPSVLWMPQLAIIGSRKPSATGRRNATLFSSSVARMGLVVTSGLATGVDGLAHQGALNAGCKTIAVAATGLDVVYPAEHADLCRQIATQGAVISEFPPGTAPRRANFPRRNRLISGLSLGTLVIEAGVRSGSLITAKTAMEQGREVFAIPGSIHNPVARGCNSLIRQGARLVESEEDLLQDLGQIARDYAADMQRELSESSTTATAHLLEPKNLAPTIVQDPDYTELMQAIGSDPVTINDLVEQTGLTVAEVSSMLLLLELNDQIEAVPGGTYCRKEAAI